VATGIGLQISSQLIQELVHYTDLQSNNILENFSPI
jgi:hypothetical protein